MKVIRSTVPVTIPERSGTRKGIVAIHISEWKWQDKFNRYVAEVTDYEVTDRENPQPGEPFKNYIPISKEEKIRTKAQIDQMFNYIGQNIVVGQNTIGENGEVIPTGASYTDQNTDIRVEGLLLETQQDPIRDSNPEDWEIVDTSTEIVQ